MRRHLGVSLRPYTERMFRRFRAVPLFAALLLSACSAQSQSQTQQGQQPTQSQWTPRTSQSQSRDPQSGLPYIAVSALPREGQEMLRLIASGGPFRYSKDGVTFGNREKLLPKQSRGYYREYTVKTPGERDRGARRIVCGGQPATNTAECYYTADHYASFRRIRP